MVTKPIQIDVTALINDIVDELQAENVDLNTLGAEQMKELITAKIRQHFQPG